MPLRMLDFTLRRGRALRLALIALTGWACSGSSGDSPVDPPNGPPGGPGNPPSGSATLTVTPATLQVSGGGTGSVTLGITRNSLTAPLSLSLSGTPVGVTGSFSPTVVDGSATSSTLSVLTTTVVAPGSYDLTIRANAQGVAMASATLRLTVGGVQDFIITIEQLSDDPPPISMPTVGLSTTLIARVRQRLGGVVPGAVVAWRSSDASVATISVVRDSAVVDGVSPGTAVISATYGNSTGTASLTVGPPIGPSTFKAVSVTVGNNHTCALKDDGTAHCWGIGSLGQLGNGSATDKVLPTPVAGGRTFVSLSAGKEITCGIDVDSAAFCWGKGVGDGTRELRLTPTPVSGGLRFREMHVAGGVNCGLATIGKLYCWGDQFLLIPQSLFSQVLAPVEVTSAATLAKSVVVGLSHGCGLDNAGQAWCFGDGRFGQRGTTEPADLTSRTRVAGGSFIDLAAGTFHSCGVTAAGPTVCWGGFNSGGELGDGTTTTRALPTQIAGTATLQALDAREGMTCGLTALGQAYCWGSGALGDNSRTFVGISSSPRRVAGGIAFSQLSVGGGLVCGVAIARSVYCWGNNQPGWVGDGTKIDRPLPTPVRSP